MKRKTLCKGDMLLIGAVLAAEMCIRDSLTAYRRMTENSLQTIPVIDADHNLYGLLRYFDLLSLLMPLNMTEMRCG